MNNKNLFWVAIIMIALLTVTVGCGVSLPGLGPDPTPTAGRVLPTTAPTRVLTQPVQPVAPSGKLTVSGTCSLTGGLQMKVDQRVNSDWQWNPNVVEEGLRGCNFLAEGRKTLASEHHIWILSHGQLNYIDNDGKFHCLECSVWAFPSDWNMDNFSTAKPPIGAEFVNAKRINMKVNNYDWPIVVHTADGQTFRFNRGDSVQNVELPNNCDFSEPQKINVTGLYDSQQGLFTASIGAEGCRTVAWLDSMKGQWPDAKDNVTFRKVTAYLIPSGWSQDQIDKWSATASH